MASGTHLEGLEGHIQPHAVLPHIHGFDIVGCSIVMWLIYIAKSDPKISIKSGLNCQ